ncbi:MAG TPA: hypothetical protein PKE49_15205, partial [Leptospiraceae bacterium]|nr:hypothetical protein [Leptospiraceae bacterium]
CIAARSADYLHIARRLAADLPLLARLRGELRARLAASPLGDRAGFARAVEAAYRAMWRAWCATTP